MIDDSHILLLLCDFALLDTLSGVYSSHKLYSMRGKNVTTYADIQRILDAAIGAGTIGAHGAFWRTLSRDQFVSYKVFGTIPILAANQVGGFDPDESNLVKALEGRAPFGRDIGVPGAKYRRMPAGRAPVSAADIALIRDWIAACCPG